MTNEFEDCGLDGPADDPVKIGAFNRLLRRIGVNHLVPVQEVATTMQKHVEECAKLQARIAGGITVIMWMLGICTAVGTALLIALLTHKYVP